MTEAPPTSFLDWARPTPAPVTRAPSTPRPAGAGTTAYGLAGLEANIGTLASTTEGSRNHALNVAAFNLGQLIAGGELEGHLAVDALTATARGIGLDEHEIAATIRSGITDGSTTPRTAPPLPDIALREFVPAVAPTRPQPTGAGPVIAPVGTIDRDPMHMARVNVELNALRARHDAKILHRAEVAAKDFRVPLYARTLTDELALPDTPVRYAVDQLLPHGGNALLTAEFKAGKTTTINHLIKCLADREPFMGRYDVDPAPGRIAVLNYEVTRDQYRRWLRDVGIVNTDNVTVLNLRGFRVPLTVPDIETWLVNWLREHQVGTVILDPFARAATGTDENSNTDVGVWLDTLDVIKERAGVRDLVLATHTGRGEMEKGLERARGATRLDDWADVRWLLTKDKDRNRFFRASGRDVETDEEQVVYDDVTRTLTLGGGDRAWVAKRTLEDDVVDYVRAHPGIGSRDILKAVEGSNDRVSAALKSAIIAHRIRVQEGARNNAKCHYATDLPFTSAESWT